MPQRAVPGGKEWRPGLVRLVAGNQSFKDAFCRHSDDWSSRKNRWSEAKHLRQGEEGAILQVDETVWTVLVLFSDGKEYHLPYEAIAKQLTIWDDDEHQRQIGLRALRGLISCLEHGKETNVFDMLALQSSRLFYPYALVCLIIQLVIPVAVNIYLTMRQIREHAPGVPWWLPCSNPSRHPSAEPVVSTMRIVISMAFLSYIVSFAGMQGLLMWSKPSAILASQSLAFDRRIMPAAKWSIFGVIFNLLSLSACLVLSLMVITVTVEPVDVVLNSLAIFFILNLDNLLVGRMHTEDFKDNFEACLKRSNADPSLPVVVHSRGFYYPLQTAKLLIFVVSSMIIFCVLLLFFACQIGPTSVKKSVKFNVPVS